MCPTCCPRQGRGLGRLRAEGKDSERLQYATDIQVGAEQRCGELLGVTAESSERGAETRRGGKSDATTSHQQTLAEMGLTKDEPSCDQEPAAMPANLPRLPPACCLAGASRGPLPAKSGRCRQRRGGRFLGPTSAGRQAARLQAPLDSRRVSATFESREYRPTWRRSSWRRDTDRRGPSRRTPRLRWETH